MPAPDLAATIERASCYAIFYGSEIAGKLDYLKENTKAELYVCMNGDPLAEGDLALASLIEAGGKKFAEGDKNPNVILGTNYEIPHMSEISAALQDGRFALIPSTYWPAGYRDEIQIMLQQLLLDGDVNAFIENMDTMTVDFYADAE